PRSFTSTKSPAIISSRSSTSARRGSRRWPVSRCGSAWIRGESMNILAALLFLLQDPVEVEGQPLAANAERVQQALDFLGAPLSAEVQAALKAAGKDAKK